MIKFNVLLTLNSFPLLCKYYKEVYLPKNQEFMCVLK
jgi:hypothetical protein